MERFSTKTPGEREDEEANRLVRPDPKVKPPRRDLRRERIKPEEDPDLDWKDPDLSLNYKGKSALSQSGKGTFEEYAEGRNFHNDKGNDVRFNSLSDAEQKKERQKWDGAQEPEPPKQNPPAVDQPTQSAAPVAQPVPTQPLPSQQQSQQAPAQVAPAQSPVGQAPVGQAPVTPVPAKAKAPAKKKEEVLRVPPRPKSTKAENLEAYQTLLNLPKSLHKAFGHLHPHDLKKAVGLYEAEKASAAHIKDISKYLKDASGYETDPNKVGPPKTGKNEAGDQVPYEQLSETEQAEALYDHSIQTAARGLAAKSVGYAVMRKNGAPKSLARTLVGLSMGKKTDPTDTFEDTLVQGKAISPKGADRLLKALSGNPKAQEAIAANLQAGSYLKARDQYLRSSSPDRISEQDSPEDIFSKMEKASKDLKTRTKALPKELQSFDPTPIFKVRVLSNLQNLDPKKFTAVRRMFDESDAQTYDEAMKKFKASKGKESAQQEPTRPANYWKVRQMSKADHDEHEAARQKHLSEIGSATKSAFSSYRSTKLSMTQCGGGSSCTCGGCQSAKVAVYHGIEPQGYPAYPDWHQAHQRDMSPKDHSILLASARDWLKEPVLANSEWHPDAKFRSALDLAIYTVDSGRYSGAVGANLYNTLLSRLSGANTDVGLTIQPKTARLEDSMKASQEIRSFATKIAGENASLSFDLLALADRVAATEKVKSAGEMPPQFKENAEKKKEEAEAKKDGDKDEKKEDKKDDKKEASYTALKSAVLKAASSDPAAKQLLRPVLQTIKQLG